MVVQMAQNYSKNNCILRKKYVCFLQKLYFLSCNFFLKIKLFICKNIFVFPLKKFHSVKKNSFCKKNSFLEKIFHFVKKKNHSWQKNSILEINSILQKKSFKKISFTFNLVLQQMSRLKWKWKNITIFCIFCSCNLVFKLSMVMQNRLCRKLELKRRVMC